MICKYCTVDKKLVFFRKNEYNGKYRPQCVTCYRAKRRLYYSNNRAKRIKQITDSREKQYRKLIIFLLNYLQNHPCVDCGETDPLVLEFDHVRGHKKYNITYMLKQAYSNKSLVQEIEKCEVRCRNCHQRKTAKQQNTMKFKIIQEIKDGGLLA